MGFDLASPPGAGALGINDCFNPICQSGRGMNALGRGREGAFLVIADFEPL